ncbi:MAG: hypothetical protein OXN86_12950 [Chloroflexota bacterium]|nr:hypothetical protein [Chloroflexota bacterium]
MPWLVLDTLGVDSAAFIGGLFLIFVAPSIIGAIAGTWILWGKQRSLFLGLLLGFAIGAGGTAVGWGLVVLSDNLAPYFVGLTLAIAALCAVAKYLPGR